jgi:hypothetical protein
MGRCVDASWRAPSNIGVGTRLDGPGGWHVREPMVCRLATMIRCAALTPFRMGISWDVPFGVVFLPTQGAKNTVEALPIAAFGSIGL